jgi:hypothetical protein
MLRYKAREKPDREAYLIYVERSGWKRNSVDERFSTASLSLPDLFLIPTEIGSLHVFIFQ